VPTPVTTALPGTVPPATAAIEAFEVDHAKLVDPVTSLPRSSTTDAVREIELPTLTLPEVWFITSV
jgi:hypothetical protein